MTPGMTEYLVEALHRTSAGHCQNRLTHISKANP